MAQEFYPNEAEQRLRSLAIILENRLRNRIQPDEVFPIVNELANRIAEQLGVSFSFRRDVADLVRPSVAENALAMNPVELFQSVARTLSFARETHLGGVPTLAPENSINQGSEAPTYTIIDVYNRKAIAKVALDAQPLFRPPPDPAEVANQRLADWLRLVVPEHP
jgi:hypothetical protein